MPRAGGLLEAGAPSLLPVTAPSPFLSEGQPRPRRRPVFVCRRAARPGAAALPLTRLVAMGNWTVQEPGSCFYGNVLEQQRREEKNRGRVNGGC